MCAGCRQKTQEQQQRQSAGEWPVVPISGAHFNIRYIHTNPFPFQVPYTPRRSHTTLTNIDWYTPDQELINCLANMPLSLLINVASFNKYMAKTARHGLRLRVARIIRYYVNTDVDDFIQVVDRLHGVYTGFALLDFINGRCDDVVNRSTPDYPLEIVMDNIAVDDLITFLTDTNSQQLIITFDDNEDPIFRTEDICTRIVNIQHEDVSTFLLVNETSTNRADSRSQNHSSKFTELPMSPYSPCCSARTSPLLLGDSLALLFLILPDSHP